MKQFTIIAMMLFLLPNISKSQCEAELQESFKQHCKGDYLSHFDFDNNSIKLKLVLKKNTVYGIYLFKKEGHKMPVLDIINKELSIINKEKLNIEDFKVETNNDSYKYYRFETPKAGVYKFTIGSESDSLSSGVMAIYHQSERKSTKIIIDARNK